MQKEKEKNLKSTDEEGDASMADPDDKGPGTEQKEEEEEILEDVGGIQFEACFHHKTTYYHYNWSVSSGLSQIR